VPRIAATPIRVVIADNHPLVVQVLSRLFQAEGDLEVVASCREGNETVLAVRQHAPDVVVLDLRLSGADGLEVIRQIRATNDATRIVVHTARLTEDELLEVRRLGVNGVVLKEMPTQLLIRCIRKVHAGEQWIEGRPLACARSPHKAEAPAPALTGREVEVLRLTATGVRNREVAHHLHVSECTVKAHLSNIYEKLGLGSRLELSLYARSEGLV
jgi:DNA-binding NarL/FixJ family response regulator